jgi:cytidylate kinase
MAEAVRIGKALADAGIASRRAADALVESGRVTVNGAVAVLGQRVDPERDVLLVDGRRVAHRPPAIYLAVAKPAGVTSTVSDRHAQRTVLSLVPRDVLTRAGRLYPVGRLDRDSEGLLLLTNDGDWAQRVLHPRYGVEREYAIGLTTELEAGQVRRLETGIDLEEGAARLLSLRRASAAETDRLERSMGRSDRPLTWYRAGLTQGWRRQIRRMLAAVGAPVERLVRVRVGTLRLEGLAPGDLRELSVTERDRLARGAKGAARSRTRPEDGRSAGSRPGLRVSLDGPGSSGKSSVGAEAARRLGYRFCDTGILYRGVGWLAVADGIDQDDAAALVPLVPRMRVVADPDGALRRLIADGQDVTDRLHTPAVDAAASAVARSAPVRAALLPVQRALAEEGRIIMAGRDIGSVVLPDAELKLFMDVSLEERARRRVQERGHAPGSREAAEVLAELGRRDRQDASRAAAPMTVPEGAILVGGDGQSFEQTVEQVVELVRSAEQEASAER